MHKHWALVQKQQKTGRNVQIRSWSASGRAEGRPCISCKMVLQTLLVQHNENEHTVEYDTDDGIEVLRYQLYSLTLVPPEKQKIVRGASVPVENDADLHILPGVVDKLRLEEKTEFATSSADLSLEKADEELARILQAEEDALFFQEQHAGQGKREFESRIRPYVERVLLYEDPVRQEAALKSIPLDELEEKAAIALAKEGNLKPDKFEEDYALLLQLLFWFKQSFRWVNQPACDGCGFETIAIGMGNPTADELQFGANRVEVYRCKKCTRITRFPRYNDPLKLVKTRSGRCGEWANCFTLYCRALGYQARLVLDFTDHLWTECFSHKHGRWMHLDPCEGAFDQPLLYEQGWNKKLNYVIALGKDGVYDVTKRYTRKWPEVLSRRLITSEANIKEVVTGLTNEARRKLSPVEKASLEICDKQESDEFEWLQCNPKEISISLPGRQSGAKEWRLRRAEVGADEDISSESCHCPVRTCTDDHVGEVYKAFGLILCKCVDDGESISSIVNELKALQTLLFKLKATPFRAREVMVGLKSDALDLSEIIKTDSIQGFLEALSLKSNSDQTGKILICLAGEPVLTSLALPVALETLEELIDGADTEKSQRHSSIVKLFRTCRRLCHASVQASGEQLPFGIATSAFDGLHSTKWEEPNGAKGSWITFKLTDGTMQRLSAYELTSANDAQERDPKDWVLEGSDDGDQTWSILDVQKSQFFERRLMRKTFMISPEKHVCNAFRFRFLSVYDANVTTRLQIASIDLYARQP